MEVTCPHCNKVIELKQKHFYHAGFSNCWFLYCNKCSNTLKFGIYNPTYQLIVGQKHPWTLTNKEKVKLEKYLAPCQCGGHFRFSAPPLCPFCKESLKSLLPDNIHFIEIGEVIDADRNEHVWLMNNLE